jgi:hypothetical protein
VSPRLPSIPTDRFEFFQKFAEIFANEDELFSSVIDTGEKFMAGVVDTGD